MVQHCYLDQRKIRDERLQKAEKDSDEHDPPQLRLETYGNPAQKQDCVLGDDEQDSLCFGSEPLPFPTGCLPIAFTVDGMIRKFAIGSLIVFDEELFSAHWRSPHF
jgi:hypothetical protein